MKTINIKRQTASLSKTLPVCNRSQGGTCWRTQTGCWPRFPPTKKFSFLEMLIPWNVFCLRQRTRPSSSGLCGTSPIGTYSCCRGSARRSPSLVRRSEQETISTTENFGTNKPWLDYSADFHAIPGIGWQRCSSAWRTWGPSRWDSGEYYPPWGDSWWVGHSWWG